MNIRFSLLVCFLVSLLTAETGLSVHFDKSLATGNVRVHYPAHASSCEAILFAVGTAMNTDSYDNMSNELITYGYLVVIMDHNPGNMVKTDPNKLRDLVEDVKLNLFTWNSNISCTGIDHWIVGGHSAGGQAAQNAVSDTPGLADAIFSIDPYDCSGTGQVNIPALYWGFEATTCFVDKDDAAKAAYLGSSGLRAFQRVAERYSWGACGYSPKFFHCSIADGHCPACTNCMTTPGYFFTDVGNSVYKFINAAFYTTWSKAALEIDNPTTPVTLFVDSEEP